MKKFFIPLLFALAAFGAQSQVLVTDTTITKPSCLTRQWNPAFSGINYAVFSAKDVGTVYSWDCPRAPTSASGVVTYTRYALVVTSDFVLNPICSTLGLDRLRAAETTATTSFFNMIRACGRPPADSSSEWDKYVRLLTIGQQRPGVQENVARQWLGADFRTRQ